MHPFTKFAILLVLYLLAVTCSLKGISLAFGIAIVNGWAYLGMSVVSLILMILFHVVLAADEY